MNIPQQRNFEPTVLFKGAHLSTLKNCRVETGFNKKLNFQVCEHLTPERLKHAEGVDRKLCEFKPDITFPQKFLSQNTDYKVSSS